MNATPRLAALRAGLANDGPEALLVTSISNVRYLTGFDGVFDEGAAAVCLVTPDTARLYTDSRYSEAAIGAASGTAWEVRVPADPIDEAVSADIAGAGLASCGFETSLAYRRHRLLSERAGTELVAVENRVEELREIKEAAEVERIAAAAALTDRAFDHILGVLAPGVTEAEIAVELEGFMRRHGSEGVAFPSIVASGPNSSKPHATVTQRALEPGDPVTLDFGARIGGYCADMTRTVVVGGASDEFRRVYEAVLAANRAGLASVRSGLTGVEIDRVARESLEGAGLAEHFGHGLGHGVGLDVHELPSVGQRGTRLVPVGSVITVEPGVYIAGRFGVRIEDLVVVEPGGCRTLSASDKELIEV